MSAQKLILVVGGTGFLGSRVLERMIACGYPLRLLTRGGHDWQGSILSKLRSQGVEVIMGDLTDEEKIAKICDGVSGVVNMAGVFKEDDSISFEEVHIQAIERLIEHGEKAGVKRFVHVSCLGARSQADCRYFQTKYEGEELVKDSGLLWTVFKPSYMFAEQFPLLDYFKPLLKFKLFLPVIGSGTNTVQPVYVEDVADCIVQSIYERETVNKQYDLVGPDEYSMVELLEMTRKSLSIGGPTMHIPSQLSGRAFDMVTKAMPRSIFTNDLAGLMSADSYGEQDEMLENFKVRNISLRQHFPNIVKSLQR